MLTHKKMEQGYHISRAFFTKNNEILIWLIYVSIQCHHLLIYLYHDQLFINYFLYKKKIEESEREKKIMEKKLIQRISQVVCERSFFIH